MNNQQLIAYPQPSAVFSTDEVILDLFTSEPIPLTLNVDDFTNAAEADASYSKSFDIPGTKNNNKFFHNIYNVTSSSAFNTHLKTRIRVTEDTLNTFDGYLQLNNISNKNGVITYNITLYSEVVNLKESIGSKVFRDLDLSELNNAYSKINIVNSWTGALVLENPLPTNTFAGTTGDTTTDVLKYPMVNWAKVNTVSSQVQIDGNVVDYFRPWVNALYLLRNIFFDAGYTFTSSFLSSTTFSKLFVDFNFDNSQAVLDRYIQAGDIIGTYGDPGSNVNATTIDGGSAALYNSFTDTITAVNNGTTVTAFGNLFFNLSNNNVLITIEHSNTNPLYSNPSSPYVITYTPINTNGNISTGFGGNGTEITLDAGDTINMKIRSAHGAGGTDPTVSIDTSTDDSWVSWTIDGGIANTNLDDILLGFRGDTSQWDYFKGIIDMFKLVILVDENNPTNLLIEPYVDWVGAGNKLDWTNKIDESEFLYTPIDGLAREIQFNYTEDSNSWESISLNHPYKWLWGYKYNSGIEIIDKDKDEVVISIFADTLVEDILVPGTVLPQILDTSVANGDNPLRFWENEMRILYDNGVHAFTGCNYSMGDFSGETDRLLFSAAKDFPITSSSKSLRFSFAPERYSNLPLLNNLYMTYWGQYIDELYHPDTRIIKVEAYLTAEDIYNLNFNDTILIKSTRYRIYKIDYRSGSMSKLELITIINL